ncbi:FAD-dependent thymidylate synthase [Streptomyces sp. URMC 125]|uniref:FAD-dependent thymidylate synthase n=1 Tax=Streptomyces sp. URMC 125 TaxID=3423419 RepID=UPI003F1E1456
MYFRSEMTVTPVKTNARDLDVVMAARVSTLGSDSANNDKPVEGLINFLMRDKHGSPFEHSTFTFLVEAPIFVAREFMRHRAGWSYNEESGRYRELKPVFYIPANDRKLVQVGKAGAYTFEAGAPAQYECMWDNMQAVYTEAYERYRNMLHNGIAREVARMVLPVGLYTSFYASCNSRSLMHFLSLRTRSEDAKFPSFPQREIEMVAEKMENHFRTCMPITHTAFVRHGRVAP